MDLVIVLPKRRKARLEKRTQIAVCELRKMRVSISATADPQPRSDRSKA
jgi:hypothetical protein